MKPSRYVTGPEAQLTPRQQILGRHLCSLGQVSTGVGPLCEEHDCGIFFDAAATPEPPTFL